MNVENGSLGLQSFVAPQSKSVSDASRSSGQSSLSKPTEKSESFNEVLNRKAKEAPDRRKDIDSKKSDDKQASAKPNDSKQPGLKKQDGESQAAQTTESEQSIQGKSTRLKSDDSTINQPTKAGEIQKSTVDRTKTLEIPLKASQLNEAVAQNPEASQQEAMVKFLLAMKVELGVEPQDVVAAMNDLSDAELLQAPEETMNQVLSGLQLMGPQRIRAEELYQTMLKDTAQASLTNWASKSGKNVDFKVMGPQEAKQQKLLSSLERMNQEFFVQNRPGPNDQGQVQAEKDKSAMASMIPVQTGKKEQSAFEMPKFFAAAGAAAGVGLGANKMAEVAKPAIPDASAMNATEFAQLGEYQVPTGGMTQAPFDVEPMAKSFDSQPSQFTSTLDALTKASFAPAGAMASQMSEDSGESSGDEFSSEQNQGQTFQVPTPGKPVEMFAPVTMGRDIPVKAGDEAANVRQVIQGAQLLIQKGGGEMKVQMSPEGMGQVDLKVSVQDGRVNIQMMAENNDTKRLLESGLADLKDGLMGQKLSLDNVKVDVSNKSQFDSSSQFADQQREMARDFLGSFRQQNQASRGNFFETTGLKNYGAKRRVMGPSDVPASARTRDSNRKLDLVA